LYQSFNIGMKSSVSCRQFVTFWGYGSNFLRSENVFCIHAGNFSTMSGPVFDEVCLSTQHEAQNILVVWSFRGWNCRYHPR